MKKQMILLTVVLLIVSIVLSVYFSNKKKEPLSVEEQLPTSKEHKHIAPDGTVVTHRHTYEITDLPDTIVKPKQVPEAKHPIQRAWEALDLAAIKRKYQRYTVAEMQEMWSQSYMTNFGPNYPHELDEAYPQVEWLQRNLELGQHFAEQADYELTLGRRYMMVDHQHRWKIGDAESRAEMRGYLDLPPDVDTWEEYEDAFLKTLITSYHTFRVATEADPDIEGGTVGTDGTLVPFKENTVYVHVNPESDLSTFTGTDLTNEEEDALIIFGVPPEGITVIYTDESGKPLSSDTPPPTFYPEIPPELRTPDAINRWFTELEVLHGGQLPEDLQALREVITGLEQVRQDAEKHTKPPPRPERPAPPEGSPPPDQTD